MIPTAYITEWQQTAPWSQPDMVEQDLIICRALVELFSHEHVAQHLAFRGGTALYKLCLGPVGSDAGPKTQYIYDASVHGMLAQVNYNINAVSGAAPYVKYQYDNTVKKRLWLSSLTNYRSDGSKISSFDYTFDNAGNRNRITEANGDYTDFAYDGSYRLRSETRKTSTNSQIYAYDYQYDEIDNRTKKILTNSAPGSPKTYTYTYGDNNVLTGVSGASSGTFGYDNYGNQTSRSIGGWSYGYDSRNQMTSATKTGTSISIKYDPLGRRVEKIGPSGTTRYIYDGDSMIAETDGTNTIAAWYTPGICETRKEGSAWNTYYYACDALGSTRELTDSLQRVTDAQSYNAWGEEQGELRPDNDPNKPKNPLRFVGKSSYYSDDDLGLDLLGARYYDPLLGRFITQDPSRDGLNWYAYCGNNPVNGLDPTGLSEVQLSALQRATLNRALGDVAVVSPAYHEGIVAFRAAYGIKYDSEENGGAIYWRFGWHMCLGSKFDDANLAPLPLKHSVDRGFAGNDFWGFRMAATLVHEYTHYKQGAFSHSGTRAEVKAYQAALDFLGNAFDMHVGLYSRQYTIANVYKTYLGDTYAWASENGANRNSFSVRDDILNILGNPAEIMKKL